MAALAAGLAVVAWPSALPRPPTLSKALPAIELYVARGDTVERWDGHRSVETHDRLQLRVAPAGYGHLLVATRRAGEWVSIHQAGIAPTHATALPLSWEVDDADPVIELGVLLCRSPCTLAALDAAARNDSQSADLWWTTLSLTHGVSP